MSTKPPPPRSRKDIMTTLLRGRPAPSPAGPLDPKPEPASSYEHIDGLFPTGRAAGGPCFMDLPPEIHLLVSKELIYPDALSLKHTSRYLYDLVDTGVRLKVAWLMERRMLHLDCPNDRKCNLRTDLEFCRGSVTSVTLIPGLPFRSPVRSLCRCKGKRPRSADIPISQLMRRRREHIECESRPGLGCLVYDTPKCAHRKDWRRRWVRRQITIEIWWVLLAAIPLLLGWLWMTELVGWVVAR